MAERDIDRLSRATDPPDNGRAKPQEHSHSLLSLMQKGKENVLAPAVNSFAVEPVNAGINVLNWASEATTWATNKLAHTSFKAPEVSKIEGMHVAQAEQNSLGFYSQQIFGTSGSLLTYAVAGKGAGKLLREAGELTPIELEVRNLKVGTAVHNLSQDARVAQVLGATAYAGLKDPGKGETHLSNAAGTFVSFSAFELGNSHLVNPTAGLIGRTGQRAVVGMYGGIAQAEVTSLINEHRGADGATLNASALSGGIMNALIPGSRKIADATVESIYKGTGARTTSKLESSPWRIESPSRAENFKAGSEPPQVPAHYTDIASGKMLTMDPANRQIHVKDANGTQVTLSVSDADMKPVPGSKERSANIWQSPDGKTMWYRDPQGEMMRADSRDYSLRYGPKGVQFYNRDGFVDVDNAGQSSRLVDGLKWNGTADPDVWKRPDGSTLEIKQLDNDTHTKYWKSANGSERYLDSHGAEWFKGKGEDWREVGTWDSHTRYTHAPDGDHWTEGKNGLYRDNQGSYWQSENGGPYISEDGKLKLLPNGKSEVIGDTKKGGIFKRATETTEATEASVKDSPEVAKQLEQMRSTQKNLSELPVDQASIRALSDGGMGHEAYVLDLIGPNGPQRAVFRATDVSEQPGLANTRMRKDLAAQELSAHLFDAFPAGVEREIEINGVKRKGWIQDASVFSDHRKVTDLQNKLHDLAAKAFPESKPSPLLLRHFLNGGASDPELRVKGPQIKEALEQALVERLIFGDLDNHALNFVADFKANPPVVRHIDLDKAMRVHENTPSLTLNNLTDSGLQDIVDVFSNSKLSANTRERVTEFLKFYDTPAGRQKMKALGILDHPTEASTILARALWLRDHGAFPEARNMFG